MTTPVYAPYVPTYATREPYITASEFLAAPTGTDTTQLIPGGDVKTNIQALQGVIQRASSYADIYCRQVLAATLDVQSAPPEGWLIRRVAAGYAAWIPVDYTPVVQVNAISLGWDTGSVSALTDLTGVWISQKVVSVPVTGLLTVPTGAAPGFYAGAWPGYPGNRVWGQMTYVNGWANAALPSATLAGVTSLPLTDVLGIYPGLTVGIYDALMARYEQVTVASDYVPGATPVPLTAATVYPHDAGTLVSSLPPGVRQAVISLTSALIKIRGGESIVLAAIREEPNRQALGEPGISGDITTAKDLLGQFRRVP